MKTIRVVAIGASDILKGCWAAYAKATGITLVGVVSRSREKAQELIDQRQAICPMGNDVTAYEGWGEALESEDFDAVYISVPTKIRPEFVVLAAKAGKSVLVEKPGAESVEVLQQLTDLCTKQNVQFMDNTMFMHSARMEKLREACGEIGRVQSMHGSFSFMAPEDFYETNIRTEEFELGAPGDLLWYIIRMFNFVKNDELPSSVTACFPGVHDERGGTVIAPANCSCSFTYEDGTVATAFVSFNAAFAEELLIVGETAVIRMHDFVLPDLGATVGFDYCTRDLTSGDERKPIPIVERRSVPEREQGRPDSQDTKLLNTFAILVRSGKPDARWPSYTLATQRVLDAVFRSAELGESVSLS